MVLTNKSETPSRSLGLLTGAALRALHLSGPAEAEGGGTFGWGRLFVSWREPLKHEAHGGSGSAREATSGGGAGSACAATVNDPHARWLWPDHTHRKRGAGLQHARPEAAQHRRSRWSQTIPASAAPALIIPLQSLGVTGGGAPYLA